MARYRNRMSLRPINRIKHVIDNSATLAAAAQLAIVLVNATDTPTLAVTTSVTTGCRINGFYIRAEVASNETEDVGAIPNVYMILWKNPGGNLTAPVPNAVGGNDNKRFVIHQEMTMIENSKGGNARTIFNGVIKIPKGMARCGPLDEWNLEFLSPALDIVVCVQCHYKEFK